MSICRFVVDGCGDFVARDSKEDVQKRQAFFCKKVRELQGWVKIFGVEDQPKEEMLLRHARNGVFLIIKLL